MRDRPRDRVGCRGHQRLARPTSALKAGEARRSCVGPRVAVGNRAAETSCRGAPSLLSARTSVNYLTDGTHLYEIVARRTIQNFGRTRGLLRYIIIRDCVTESITTVDEVNLAALTVVR